MNPRDILSKAEVACTHIDEQGVICLVCALGAITASIDADRADRVGTDIHTQNDHHFKCAQRLQGLAERLAQRDQRIAELEAALREVAEYLAGIEDDEDMGRWPFVHRSNIEATLSAPASPAIGSTLTSFLEEQGIKEEVDQRTREKIDASPATATKCTRCNDEALIPHPTLKRWEIRCPDCAPSNDSLDTHSKEKP